MSVRRVPVVVVVIFWRQGPCCSTESEACVDDLEWCCMRMSFAVVNECRNQPISICDLVFSSIPPTAFIEYIDQQVATIH